MTTDDRRPATGGGQAIPPTVRHPASLSVAIIARDEARHIGAALDSVKGLTSDVLVLLDDRTTDATAETAQMHGARVLIEPWRGFSAQRNRVLDIARTEWVLFLDADERVTPELADEIRLLPFSLAGYWIPRHNQFFGKVVRGGGWYPDYQLRLLRRKSVRYDESQFVHETARLAGDAGYLRGHFEHINIERFGEFWRKQRAYAIQEAQMLFREGRKVRWRNFVGAPIRELNRRFFKLGGWRDGLLGLLLCAVLAYFEFVKFVHLKAITR